MEIGDIVFSKAGRDANRHYVVIAVVDDSKVKIADGDLRHIKCAKLKNVKHLHSTGDKLERIAEKLKNGLQVYDAELYSALRFYNDNNK